MSEKSTILVVGNLQEDAADLIDRIGQGCDVVQAQDPLEALSKMSRSRFSGIYVVPDQSLCHSEAATLLRSDRILNRLPDGIAVVDCHKTIIWANHVLHRWVRAWGMSESLLGRSFYDVFQSDVGATSACPFQRALEDTVDQKTVLKIAGDRYLHLQAVPLPDDNHQAPCVVVALRDITGEVLQRQKLEAIHRAGSQLTDLKPDEIFALTLDDRIGLLKDNILRFTKDVLKFDVVEIRLLDQQTGELVPLLSEGIDSAASKIKLFANETHNGVTGHVAATGRSYLCEDTAKDTLYIQGFQGAKCSLTVPIIHHDDVIGTFNVESPIPGIFTQSDVQFLEIFCRSVAVALNTFELLVAQQATTAQASVEAIHSEVVRPVDEILNETVNVMGKYIGHDPDVTDRLQRVLKNARYIKEVIQRVGERMAPAEAVPDNPERNAWPRLKNRRILVVDADDAVRQAAHALLERHGCTVETAHDGNEAAALVLAAKEAKEYAYDVIITAVRLPDMSGYGLYVKLKELLGEVPLVLMQGFGYDPGHAIVKAREAGLRNPVLYKPFRLDQLLETVDLVIVRNQT